VRALIRTAEDVGVSLGVLKAVEVVNERQKGRLFEKLQALLGSGLSGGRVAVWGLAFKAETDDMRESPALTLVRALLDTGAEVRAHDPVAIPSARAALGERVCYYEHQYDALQGADALVIVTEWLQFRNPDFDRMKALLRQPIIVDGRNLYDPTKMRALGFTYTCIGRAPS
jgi:UDPglucose 6-dehydrogenase